MQLTAAELQVSHKIVNNFFNKPQVIDNVERTTNGNVQVTYSNWPGIETFHPAQVLVIVA